MIKTLTKINKQINMLIVSIVLVFFYFIAFGLAKIIFHLLHKPISQPNTYWHSHIEKKQIIDYASPY